MANNARQHAIVDEIDTGDPGVYVEVSAAETIVPHTTLTGGIEGADDPYPPVRVREFANGSDKPSKEYTAQFDKGNGPVARVAQESAPVAEGPAELPIARVDSEEPPPPPRGGSGESSSGAEESMIKLTNMLTDMVRSEMATANAGNSRRSAAMMATSPSYAGAEARVPSGGVPVRFAGPFGTITAPFRGVVKGSGCVALLRSTDQEEGWFDPPVDMDGSLDIEWKEDGVARKAAVVNAGLAFEVSPGLVALVMLLKEEPI